MFLSHRLSHYFPSSQSPVFFLFHSPPLPPFTCCIPPPSLLLSRFFFSLSFYPSFSFCYPPLCPSLSFSPFSLSFPLFTPLFLSLLPSFSLSPFLAYSLSPSPSSHLSFSFFHALSLLPFSISFSPFISPLPRLALPT